MSNEKHGSRFSVSWVGLSLTLGVVTLASLATLVVIVSIKDIDLLSSVALTLAILAFAAQIIVFLFQSQSTVLQTISSEKIAAETRSLLSEISIKSASLLANQSTQFDKVLQAALDPDAVRRAVEVATGEKDSEEDVQDKPKSNISAEALSFALREGIRETFQQKEGAYEVNLDYPRNRYDDYLAEMRSYPGEEQSADAIAILMKMSPMEISYLTRLARSDIVKARRGMQPEGNLKDVIPRGPLTQGLLDKGLTALRPQDSGTGEKRLLVRTLTPLGRTVARILNASDQNHRPPQWLLDAFQ